MSGCWERNDSNSPFFGPKTCSGFTKTGHSQQFLICQVASRRGHRGSSHFRDNSAHHTTLHRRRDRILVCRAGLPAHDIQMVRLNCEWRSDVIYRLILTTIRSLTACVSRSEFEGGYSLDDKRAYFVVSIPCRRTPTVIHRAAIRVHGTVDHSARSGRLPQKAL
jgi:hypothetical protein